MERDKNHIEIDPDYEGNNTAIRNAELKEEQENELTSEKLSRIIQEQFDKELADRQQQIEEIEDRIFRAQKLLHVVRYVLISSYYNNKNLELNAQEEFQDVNILAGQNRIHPAVKKLLGKNTTNWPILSGRTKRKAETKCQVLNTVSCAEPAPKKNKLNCTEVENDVSVTNNVKREITHTETSNNLVMNRLKTEHRIVVGNISYSKKSLEQEHLMHKWMVYIKIYKGCSREGPDLATKMMQKVVFYLHPSYKPHDVVEISNPPFHLSRRGWGEFPIRVQIFFKSGLNKPVDIIHNLKLDHTFVGRQTIGNETVVPIFLNDFESVLNPDPKTTVTSDDISRLLNGVEENSSFEHDYCQENIKTEVVETEEVPIEEHDYCFEENKIKVEPENDVDILDTDTRVWGIVKSESGNDSLLDHSYSLPQGIVKKEKTIVIAENNKKDDQPQTKLIYGLGDSYLDVNENVKNSSKIKEVLKDKPVVQTLVTATGQQIRFLPQSFSKILLNNGSIVQVKVVRRPGATPRKVVPSHQSTGPKLTFTPQENYDGEIKIDREKYKLTLPTGAFRNVAEVLPYLFRRLPLWNELATDLDFKCTYPFVARSVGQYKRWNVGKKLCAEWSRAKTIRNLLRLSKFCDYAQWSTKAIFMYGRSHCYTPLVKSYKIFRNDSPERRVLLSMFSHGERTRSKQIVELNSHEIDIVSEAAESPSSSASNLEDISDESLKYECAFVKESALDCGVILKPEPLAEGVTMNAAERTILEAVRCFADGLIRRATHHLVSKETFEGDAREITASEVTAALNERPEFRSLTHFRRRRSEIDYFFMS